MKKKKKSNRKLCKTEVDAKIFLKWQKGSVVFYVLKNKSGKLIYNVNTLLLLLESTDKKFIFY